MFVCLQLFCRRPLSPPVCWEDRCIENEGFGFDELNGIVLRVLGLLGGKCIDYLGEILKLMVLIK